MAYNDIVPVTDPLGVVNVLRSYRFVIKLRILREELRQFYGMHVETDSGYALLIVHCTVISMRKRFVQKIVKKYTIFLHFVASCSRDWGHEKCPLGNFPIYNTSILLMSF